MKELLNLLQKATPEQLAELGNALHIVQQISVAEKRYEGASKADFYERLRAASNLNKFVETLHAELTQSSEYQMIMIFSRQLTGLGMNGDFRDWLMTDYGNPFTANQPAINRRTYMEAGWSQARRNFKDLVEGLTFNDMVNVVEVLHKEGAGLIGRNYSVDISEDKKQVHFTVANMRALVLYDFEQ
jgi:hypothetical protein